MGKQKTARKHSKRKSGKNHTRRLGGANIANIFKRHAQVAPYTPSPSSPEPGRFSPNTPSPPPGRFSPRDGPDLVDVNEEAIQLASQKKVEEYMSKILGKEAKGIKKKRKSNKKKRKSKKNRKSRKKRKSRTARGRSATIYIKEPQQLTANPLYGEIRPGEPVGLTFNRTDGHNIQQQQEAAQQRAAQQRAARQRAAEPYKRLTSLERRSKRKALWDTVFGKPQEKVHGEKN